MNSFSRNKSYEQRVIVQVAKQLKIITEKKRPGKCVVNINETVSNQIIIIIDL